MVQTRLVFILHGLRCPRSLPDRLLQRFAAHYQVDIHITTSAVSAEDMALQAVAQGCDYLIAVGGDGTIHEVINGVMRADAAARERVAVGALPFGTGNDFVRSLGVNDSLEQLEQLIASQRVRRIDLGRLSLRGEAGERVIWFGNIASLGISSAIVEQVRRLPGWLPASVAFYLSILLTLLRYRPRRMQLTLEGGEVISGDFLSLCVANGRYFGSGLGIAPMARLDDGLLEVVMIKRGGGLDFLRHLPSLRKAQPVLDERVRYLSVRSLRIEGQACPLEVDGELAGYAPVHIEVLPQALRCLSALGPQGVAH
ncbi:transcription regulator [Aquitalea magnusonii]|jgi:YegS/Rv2252/BmrU family lipid kinase|uniref:Transcription regulator n=1 Tax=Aquitalea magnusonii TaxID=332411 RepID=A0A3G9GN74_9NEIS|nr:diacylglycerol kinase family protein [Aquitalea magnusonii]BBF86586.1 transcription regulator [Aquitalea magnusonii]